MKKENKIVGILERIEEGKTIYILPEDKSVSKLYNASSRKISKHLKKYGKKVDEDWLKGKKLKETFMVFLEGGYYGEYVLE